MSSTQDFLPIVLVRGFDPLATSDQTTYYGWNDGTVYPHKKGENFIYEGMLVKFLKTTLLDPKDQQRKVVYKDATNAICYTAFKESFAPVDATHPSAKKLLDTLKKRDPAKESLNVVELGWLSGASALDPGVARAFVDVPESLWVYRFYDFKNRDLRRYADELKRVIEMVKAITGAPAVNLICHSMGGIIARYLLQKTYGGQAEAEANVNKLVTLGSPHRGIAFQGLDMNLPAELEFFNERFLREKEQFDRPKPRDLGDLGGVYDPKRVLCIVGTNHATYIGAVSALNQIVSWLHGQDQNHSDGLVKQDSARLTGAYRADVHKCHGGNDSLITSREAFELATRFFFGNVEVTVKVNFARIHDRRAGLGEIFKKAIDGAPEYFIGFSVKPRSLDFFLHYQKEDSENCFGPFSESSLGPADFRWDPADRSLDGVIYQGFLNSALGRFTESKNQGDLVDLVVRFDVYVAERDSFILGHSDQMLVDTQSYFKVQKVDDQFEILFIPNLSDDTNAIKAEMQSVKDGVATYTLTLDQTNFKQNIDLDLEISFRLR
jgi:pimeloyl-ACP methyl ester carboxylesterase